MGSFAKCSTFKMQLAFLVVCSAILEIKQVEHHFWCFFQRLCVLAAFLEIVFYKLVSLNH